MLLGDHVNLDLCRSTIADSRRVYRVWFTVSFLDLEHACWILVFTRSGSRHDLEPLGCFWPNKYTADMLGSSLAVFFNHARRRTCFVGHTWHHMYTMSTKDSSGIKLEAHNVRHFQARGRNLKFGRWCGAVFSLGLRIWWLVVVRASVRVGGVVWACFLVSALALGPFFLL